MDKPTTSQEPSEPPKITYRIATPEEKEAARLRGERLMAGMEERIKRQQEWELEHPPVDPVPYALEIETWQEQLDRARQKREGDSPQQG